MLLTQTIAPPLTATLIPPLTATVAPPATSTPTPTVEPSVTPPAPTATPSATPPLTATVTISDLVPPGLVMIPAVVNPVDGSESAVVTGAGAGVLFLESQAAVIAGPGAFSQSVRLLMRPQAVLSVTQQQISTTTGLQIVPTSPDQAPIRFELEASREPGGGPVPRFDQPVRLVFDLRRLAPPGYRTNWYVAYQDEADPQVWHRVPVTVHDPAGLISVETDHFSTWVAGNEPGAWHYHWNLPTVSTFSGAASYQYPLPVPPGRGGLAPDVNLSYSSRGVDSLILSNQDQGPLGLGWSLSQIEIARDGVHIASDATNIHPSAFSLVMNGTSYELKSDGNEGANTARYYARNGPQLYIERVYDPAAVSDPNNPLSINPDKFYWQVKTPDGRTYRLGYTRQAESGQSGAQVVWGHGGADGGYSGIRWRVDTLTDFESNRIEYRYETWDRSDSYWNGNNWVPLTTGLRRVSDIFYNFTDSTPTSYQSRVEFLDNNKADNRIREIKLYHTNTATPYKRYVIGLDSQPHTNCGQSTTTNRILSIIEKNGDGTQALPTTSFSHGLLEHHYNGCYSYYYLEEVNNGYGGRMKFFYQNDTRLAANCGGTCIPEFGYSYFVYRTEVRDGLHADTQPAVVEYSYYKPCFDQENGNPVGDLPGAFSCLAREGVVGAPYGKGPLVGFEQTSVTYKDHDGQTVLGKAFSQFHQTLQLMGKPNLEQQRDASGTAHQQVESQYATVANGPTSFTFANVVTTTVFDRDAPPYDPNQIRTVKYFYNPAQQGGVQYGNLTEQVEYLNGQPYRRSYSEYIPNTTTWLVSQPGFSNVDGLQGQVNPCPFTSTSPNVPGYTWCLASSTWYNYDTDADPSFWQTAQSPHVYAARRWNGQNPVQFVDTRYEYDAWGNQTAVKTYTGYGIGSSYAGGSERRTTTVYDSTYHLYPVLVINPANQSTNISYDNVLGVPLSVTDANGAATEYRYDVFGRLTHVYRPGDTVASGLPTVQYHYGDGYIFGGLTGLRIQEDYREISGNGAAYRPVVKFYDGLGRLVQERAETLNGSQMAVTNYTFDGLGRVIHSYVPTLENGTGTLFSDFNRPAGWDTRPKTSQAYDALGRVSVITATDGVRTEHRYGVVSDGGVSLAYDDVLDPNRHRVQHRYDALGRLAKVYEIQGDCGDFGYSCTAPYTTPWATYAPTTYSYSILDQLTTVVDFLNNSTFITYNALGQKKSMVDPDLGAWNYFYDDATGNLTRQTDAKNQRLCLYYDVLGRLTGKRYNGASDDCTGASRTITYSYDAGVYGIGRRTGMTDPSGSASWNYDARGRVITETKVVTGTGGGTFKTAWGYDAADRVTWMKYPGGNAGEVGEQVSYTYNNQWLLSNVAGTSTYLSSASYDAAGRPELLTLPGSNLQVDYVYFPWTSSGGRVQQIKSGSTADPTARQDLRYTYDAVGNVRIITDTKVTGGPQIQTFSYDFLDRLVSAVASGGTGGTYGLETYTYNQVGNLMSKTGVGTYTYPAPSPATGCAPGTPLTKAHAVSAAGTNSYSYDCNGNLTTRNIGTSYTLSYDPENHLTGVSGAASASYVYDGDGQRVKGTVAGVTTLYIGSLLEIEMPLAAPTPTPTPIWTPTPTRTPTPTPTPTRTPTPCLGKGCPTPTPEFCPPKGCAGAPQAARRVQASLASPSPLARLLAWLALLLGLAPAPAAEPPEMPPNAPAPIAGQTWKFYYYAGGQRLAMRTLTTSSNQLHYLLGDHLGSTALTLDSGGSLVAEVRYKAWGATRYSSGATPTTYRFTGQRQESGLGGTEGGYATGLYYYGSRWYDPVLGRFLSADSIVPEPGNPQSLNRYAYAENNPLRYTDPTGHWIESALDIAFIAYDLYDISQHGLTWESGLSLAADVGGLLLPVATGGGLAVRAAFHADDVAKVLTHADDVVRVANAADNLTDASKTLDNLTDAANAVCSFSAETLVSTADGYQPIGSLEPGDVVLAYHEGVNATGYYTVTATWLHIDPVIEYLTIDGETVEVTPEHPFFTAEMGWVAAGDLWLGARVMEADGDYGVVEHVTFMHQPQAMYNLTVAEAHTFFVGQQQWLVHNTCTIHGNVQPNTSPQHQYAQLQTALDDAYSGNYDDVYLGHTLGTTTGGQIVAPVKPDVVSVNPRTLTVKITEVISGSQYPGKPLADKFEATVLKTIDAIMRSKWTVTYNIIEAR